MSRLSRKAFMQALLSTPCLFFSGCAHWLFAKREEEPSRLPQVPITEDVIVAEVSLIKAREAQTPLVEEAWRLADEQITPIARRRDLEANGFRCGRFGGNLPDPLRSLLKTHEEQVALAKTEGELAKDDPTVHGLRMQLRAARKGEIRVRSALPQISVLLSNNGIVSGGTFPDASCSFLIRGYPAAAANAEIELTPYIEYGLPMRNWNAQEGELEMTIARPKEEFSAMKILCQLGPGEVLLVGPNAPAKGLGGVFFHEHPQSTEHSLLLVRLALSQSDGAFRPSSKANA